MNKRKNLFKAVLIIVFVFTLFLTVSISSAFYLPDTGQTTCYSDKGKGREIVCPAPEQPLAQDGSYSINPPSYKMNGDGTVTDNNTFLEWQQSDDGLLRTWDQAGAYCENLGIGGHTDWRLPSGGELSSIVHYGNFNPAIDSAAFGNAKASAYWASTVSSGDSSYAWLIDFNNGAADNRSKNEGAYVRCARGAMDLGHLRKYFNLYTVGDEDTGLLWQEGDGGQMKWGYALNYCEDLSHGGYSDWRLPNVRELELLFESLIDFRKDSPWLAYDALFNPISGYYWSSTTNAADTGYGWITSLGAGSTTVSLKRDRENHVRCVRGGKTDLLDYRELAVTPSALDFGYLGINESKSLNLTVTNI